MMVENKEERYYEPWQFLHMVWFVAEILELETP